MPVQGDLAGYDRPVQWDVYTSTSRVYVFMDGKPSACAVLPAGRMPAGPVTVAYRAVIYHCGIDETVTPADTGHQYEHHYSLCHSDRHMDDFGIDLAAPAPAWDETSCRAGRSGMAARTPVALALRSLESRRCGARPAPLGSMARRWWRARCGGGGGGGATANDDPDPTFTPDERAALAALRYDDGPPPADPSNRVADDPAARRFGQRLFFDPAFSGRLLEGDNDGTAGTLGRRATPAA